MGTKSPEQMSPEQAIKQGMDTFDIDRQTAMSLLQKAVEATLQVEGEMTEEAINRKMAEMFMREGKSRAPWFMAFMQAHYRKRIPGWIKLNDEAHEKGWDAVTAMSIQEKILVEMAEDRIKLVRLAKEGKTIEEITEAAVALDDGRSVEELYSMIARQMG